MMKCDFKYALQYAQIVKKKVANLANWDCFKRANIGACPIIVAEIWGINYVLLLAWNKRFRQIMLEVDSSNAIDLINKEFNPKHPYASVINNVQQLLHSNWMVRVADFLASCGHTVHLGVCFYDFPPTDLGAILRDDLARVSFPRYTL